MFRKSKKLIAMALAVAMMMGMSTSVFAMESNKTGRDQLAIASGEDIPGYTSQLPDNYMEASAPGQFSYKEINTVDELVQEGLTLDEASRIIFLNDVAQEMYANGQSLQRNGQGEIIVTNPQKNGASISDEKISQLINYANEFSQMPTITQEQRDVALQNEIDENPNQNYYRVEFLDGSWSELSVNDSVESVSSDRLEMNTIDIFGESGSKTRSSEWRQYSPVHFCNSKMQYTYNVSDKNKRIELTGLNHLVTSSGTFEIYSESSEREVTVTDYDESPTIWCQSYGEIIWNSKVSSSVSLGGVFDISIDANGYWTQVHEVDISLTNIHTYATAL